MIIVCLLLNLCSKNCEKWLVNNIFMICCMTCSWAQTAGGTTAPSGQRNDGVMAPNTPRLHQRLDHINRTLHADIEKPISLEKNINNLHKINFYVFMTKKLNFCWKKFAFDCWHNTVLWYTTNNTQHKIHSCYIISLKIFLAVFGEVVCLSWIGLGTGGSWTVCWQRQKMVVRVRVRCTEPSLHSPHS